MQYISIDVLIQAASKIDRHQQIISKNCNKALERGDTEVCLMYQKQYVQLNEELTLITNLIDYYENLSDYVY